MKRKLAAIVLATGLVFTTSACKDEFKDNCTARNGFIKSDSVVHAVVTVDPGTGMPSVGTAVTTVRYCIIDGKINPEDIEVS